MTEHLSFDLLCDLADGALAPDVEAPARAHLRSCEECATRLSAISVLAASASALPREIAPPAGLWADIRREVRSRESIRRSPAWRLRYLVAAGIVIAVASSALTAVVLRNRQAPGTPSGPTFVQAIWRPLPASLESEERGYLQSVRALQQTLEERRAQLSPSTIEIVERSLLISNAAIAEARDALARDPSNNALARLLASNYERKIDLLRRATELAPHT